MLGILLLLGLALLAYFLLSSAENTLTETREGTVKTSLEKRDISEYVTSCLEKSLSDGLFLLGQQGGFVYEDQPGSILSFSVASYNFSDGGATIRAPVLIASPGFPIAGVPYYPCFDEQFGVNVSSLANYKGELCYKQFYSRTAKVFKYGAYSVDAKGEKIRPGLCSSRNENVESAYYCGCGAGFSCDYSIQKQLETYVQHALDSCLDFDSFKTQLGYEVKAGKSVVKVNFADEDTSVSLKLPLERVDKEGTRSLKDFDFTTSVPVRFKTIYSLVYGTQQASIRNELGYVKFDGMLENDINDVTYDVVGSTNDKLVLLSLNGFTFSRIPVGDGTLIRITDQESNVKGRNYSFWFYRENRRPALEPLRKGPPSSLYDIYALEGEDLTLRPEGFDPDEDNVTYRYTGWKADYDEVRNASSGAMIRIPLAQNTNIWENSVEYRFGVRCTDRNITQRCASISIGKADVGEHIVRISVVDDHGVSDYEDLRIFVDNRPQVGFNVSHPFTDKIPSFLPGYGFVVSVEDPVWFDASPSLDLVKSSAAPDVYFWNDSNVNASVLLFYEFKGFPYLTTELYLSYPFFNYSNTYPLLQDFLRESPRIQGMYENEFFGPILLGRMMQEVAAGRQAWLPTPEQKVLGCMTKFLSVYNISNKLGYFDAVYNRSNQSWRNMTWERNHTVELKVYGEGNILRDSAQEKVYVADCIPYRSDVPSYPFNMIPKRVLTSEDTSLDISFNPYTANHTCCISSTGNESTMSRNAKGEFDDPRQWVIAPAGMECYHEEKVGKPWDFVNVSGQFYIPSGLGIPNATVDANFSRAKTVLRVLEGQCMGDRGNICNVSHMLITLRTQVCGDKFNETPELCDDGNLNDFDSCRNDCTPNYCGDGRVTTGEQCEPGQMYCFGNCTLNTCGDGQPGGPREQCDDGNQVNDDGCPNTCSLPRCGDHIVQSREVCDDGNDNNYDFCVHCQPNVCGDHYILTHVEECDDGNTINGDGCDANCKREIVTPPPPQGCSRMSSWIPLKFSDTTDTKIVGSASPTFRVMEKPPDGNVSFSMDLEPIPTEVSLPISDKVDIALVIDQSGSMAGQKMRSLKESLVSLLQNRVDFSSQNVKIGLATYDFTARVVQTLTSDQNTIIQAVNGIVAYGNTDMYDGLVEGKSILFRNLPNIKKVIILLADGDHNTDNRIPEQYATDTLAPAGIITYTVGYGINEQTTTYCRTHHTSDYCRLYHIAIATGGNVYVADTTVDSLDDVFSTIFGQILGEAVFPETTIDIFGQVIINNQEVTSAVDDKILNNFQTQLANCAQFPCDIPLDVVITNDAQVKISDLKMQYCMDSPPPPPPPPGPDDDCTQTYLDVMTFQDNTGQCPWGQGDNGAASEVGLQARKEQVHNLRSLPVMNKICAITLSSDSQSMTYDDTLTLTFNNRVVLSNMNFDANQFLVKQGSFYLYDWSRIIGKVGPFQTYCPDRNSRSVCTLPQTQVTGQLEFAFDESLSQELLETVQSNSPEVRLINMGDGDTGSDCHHTPLTLRLSIRYN